MNQTLFMRNHILLSICFLTVLVGFTNSCTKDTITESYSIFKPVYHTKAEVKANAKSGPALAITNPGKLFVKGNYAFLSELDKGVHIIDFSNPAAPKNIAFINIPGCVDLAVRGNYLYADCYTDLVTIDISNPTAVVVQQFIEGVFPHRQYAYGFYADTNKVITSWVRVDTIVKRRMDDLSFYSKRKDLLFFPTAMMNASGTPSASNTNVTNGIGGSMAHFGLMGNRLYTVSYTDLKVFNTSNAAIPTYVKTVNFSQGNIETIFPYKDKLFLGSQTGMLIYNASNPDNPTPLGSFSHARVCDPVIAEDKYAYVTLRSGNACGGFTNQLDVLDISTLTAPTLIKSYQLHNPAGLSKDGNLLLICDGTDGLKIFDAADPNNVKQVSRVLDLNTIDVIALNGIAITVATDGLYFINYTNIALPFIAGKIALEK